MAGRLGHIDGARRVGHVPRNGIRTTNYRYGFGGCDFDLDARHGTDTVTNGALVTTWVETIKGIIYSQATGGNKPTYNSNDANFNNFPSITFGSSRFMDGNVDLSFSRDSVFAFVAKVDTITAGEGRVLLRDASSSDGLLLMVQATAGNGIGFYDSTTPKLISSIRDINPHIIIIRTESSGTTLMIDGIIEASGTHITNVSYERIGNNATTSLRGPFTRGLKWVGTFTDNDLTALSDNINSEYAIY